MRPAPGAAARSLLERITRFRDEHILPGERTFNEQVAAGETRWKPVPLMESLRAKARVEGLWNISLREPFGPGLTHLEYAPIAEVMGCNEWMPEVFNCNPPDSGNLELLLVNATAEQKQRWLEPLLAGEMRSCFAMTEPDVASSDATNVALRCEKRGDDWILNGEKWWISGAGNPLCRIAVVMCRSEPDADRTAQHTMILVPMDTPGLSIVRQLPVFGMDFAPRGFSHLRFDNVRVPSANVIGTPGKGFEIAQGRLGAARLHHAMRCVGAAERALQLMCERSLSRKAFGKELVKLGGNADSIARCRIDINLVREMALATAHRLDTVGFERARSEISQVKVAAPAMACRVLDEAIQLHGAAGLSDDTPLAALYARLRSIRIADGPDAVHLRVIARSELARYGKPGSR
jgi:acyl-CoA dehydrogenase